MLRQKREKNGTGICLVMQGKESKTCPYDFSNRSENRPLIHEVNHPLIQNFVSHSMGAALTEGIAKYLNEKGFGVSNIVHINPYQAADISTLESANTIDYQNTDDPVIHFIPFSSSGKIQNADQYIREFSGESLFYKHFWPISLGKNFWDRLGTYTYRLGTYIY